jgi:hypothetical protein
LARSDMMESQFDWCHASIPRVLNTSRVGTRGCAMFGIGVHDSDN